MYRDYSNYDVLPDGRIWSKVRKKFLKPQKNEQRGGYLYVNLYDDNGKLHNERLHKVIYCAVNGVWEIPKGFELNHLDEDKTNCAIWNISCCSHQENCNYGTRNERMAKAKSKAMKGKIPAANPPKRVGAFKDGELVMAFPSIAEAGRQGFNQGCVCNCCNGNRKTHKGYIWKFLDGEEN